MLGPTPKTPMQDIMAPHDLATTDEAVSSATHTKAINTLRFLAVDMVERARSGHPGAPMGQAPMAYRLWTRHLRYDPAHPDWPNRDRFVLSCGHASALIYGLLHLAGYDLPIEESVFTTRNLKRGRP